MSPGKSRMDIAIEIAEQKPHLMPRPSPRKLVRDISDSPEQHKRQASVDKSLIQNQENN